MLGNIGIGYHQTSGDKGKKLKKNISGEWENYLKSNYIAAISSKGKIPGLFAVIRYTGPFLKRMKEELKCMNQRTRKLMTMYNGLHPKDDISIEGGRGLTSIEESIDASTLWLEDQIKITMNLNDHITLLNFWLSLIKQIFQHLTIYIFIWATYQSL